MNDETISALGGFCTELLGTEAFTAMIQMYSQQCAVDILNTQPHELKAREGIYASYQGFEGFLSLVKKFSDAHTKLLETEATKQTTVTTPDGFDVEDDPSVHDIYGN